MGKLNSTSKYISKTKTQITTNKNIKKVLHSTLLRFTDYSQMMKNKQILEVPLDKRNQEKINCKELDDT